jgi:hypothetical protein
MDLHCLNVLLIKTTDLSCLCLAESTLTMFGSEKTKSEHIWNKMCSDLDVMKIESVYFI